MRSPRLTLKLVLLSTLLLCAITARAEVVEVYALEAMPCTGFRPVANWRAFWPAGSHPQRVTCIPKARKYN